jgi:chromosome segregation ATPase
MKLNYQTVKELTQLMTDSNKEIRATWHSGNINTESLDKVIERLNELVNSKSKLADFDELKSDMGWLEEYYKEKSWKDVTRWLSNIDSTLRIAFSDYMDKIKKIGEKK